MPANALVHLSCKPGERWVLSCLLVSIHITAYPELVHPRWGGMPRPYPIRKVEANFMSSLQYTQ